MSSLKTMFRVHHRAIQIVSLAFLLMAMPAAAFGQAPDPPLPPQPIAVGWKIAGAAVVLAALGAAIFYAIRIWRSWNLFDRQYRFPHVATAPRRLGANKAGGLLATIVFSGPAPPDGDVSVPLR
jgi:hypothetical protein